MKLSFDFEAMNVDHYENGDVDVNLHADTRSCETRVIWWPKSADRHTPYVSVSLVVALRTDGPGIHSTTYLNLDQAETMRDALTAVLNEAASDTDMETTQAPS